MKELKITPPEGYEIDKENSTFEKIVFKKVEEELTYEKIADKLFQYENYYYTDVDGKIMKTSTGWKCPNNAPTAEQLQRLLALNKLMNVAYYLNDGWEPDWDNLSTNHEFIKINKGCFTYSSRVLVFPTIEMKESFYENFKDLIENCEELL